MTIAKNIETFITRSSWIRKMFEEGARLKAEHGAENVFDFSLGNPNLEPPDKFRQVLKEIVASTDPGKHAYMPNVGYPFARKAIAAYVSTEQDVSLNENDIIMTCGAAGALNVILKAILDPGDEVITPTPYFVDYHFYADNHGGTLKTVATLPDFKLDVDAVSAAITAKTKAILINSPNNPTGQIYTQESLEQLAGVLSQKSAEFGRTIYLISDEPYRKIVYDDAVVPPVLASYPDSFVASSYSKDISIPGERIGFIAVNPDAGFKNDLLAGMALAIRILGFINAPALAQRVVAAIQGERVDIDSYDRKRKLLCNGLADCGYEFVTPPGAFYLFPRTPVPDDVAFIRALQEELILAVPGSGFGSPGHFRLAFCVDDRTIENAMPAFAKVMARFK